MVDFGNDWNIVLQDVISGANYQKIREFLKKEYSNYEVYPPMGEIFNAFKLTAYSDVKVVILGQDPYHEPKEANGLAFSVLQGVKCPPSLLNIYKELKDDLGVDNFGKTDLTSWAKRGVLLLNATLTVRRGLANSHSNCGWKEFTDDVIKKLSMRKEPIIFILWGGNARSKKAMIGNQHYIIESAHPSPLSAYNGFFGSKPFSRANDILKSLNKEPIDWQL